MSVKAISIAINLVLEDVARYQTWKFVMVAVTGIIAQFNYLNKALDTFNTAVVSPIYYAIFTSFTILCNAIMFEDRSCQSASKIIFVLRDCSFRYHDFAQYKRTRSTIHHLFQVRIFQSL